ncbi:MAG TPA: TcmI family type II polyketide cyclase [Pseudonocardiaceae bacterium]|nr:TcmI family type II polyketide cyclase [Pseudonocardiaceae bacterium]
MHRALILARIVPDSEQEVAAIFAASDRTELPRVVGVRHRSLYRLGDLYAHLVETEQRGEDAIDAARVHPEFAAVSARLCPYITPYLPTWRSPRDAQAQCFYLWEPGGGEPEPGGELP